MYIYLYDLALLLAALWILYAKFKRRVPILMYHRIADIPGDRNALPAENFEQQLRYLAQNGYNTILPDELYEHYAHKKPLPPKPVMLTFDDGYADNFTAALPLLQKYSMKAVVFPIADWIGKPNHWEHFGKKETTTMTKEQLGKWLKAGMDVQPHTCTHPFLTGCNAAQLDDEMSRSKQSLEKLLHRKMNYICYPYGFFDYNTIKAAKKAGYKMAFAIFDEVPLWNLSLYALPRIPIPSHQKMWEFKLKVSSINTLFAALRKWERAFKRLKNKIKR